MRYTPRTIAFLCEVLHPPQVPDAGPLQKVHNDMFSSGTPLYRSFNVGADEVLLSNPTARPGAVSSVAFRNDRLRFREELTGLTTDEFAKRVQSVTEMAAAARSLQIFTAQVVTIRTLINPQNFPDSRDYLREGVFGLKDELSEFGREPQLYGMRLVFAPGPETPNAFTLRIESFASDPRSLFIENQGGFGPLVVARGMDALQTNIHATYEFVVEKALRFLGHFDARQEA